MENRASESLQPGPFAWNHFLEDVRLDAIARRSGHGSSEFGGALSPSTFHPKTSISMNYHQFKLDPILLIMGVNPHVHEIAASALTGKSWFYALPSSSCLMKDCMLTLVPLHRAHALRWIHTTSIIDIWSHFAGKIHRTMNSHRLSPDLAFQRGYLDEDGRRAIRHLHQGDRH